MLVVKHHNHAYNLNNMNPSAQDLTKLFNPKSIAVVGASPNPKKVGNISLRNILDSGYKGKLWCVNPNYSEIVSIKSYKSVTELPEIPDLVIISIPVESVLAVVEECGVKGVKNLVVYSAGFKELGKEGLALENVLIELANKYKTNLLGPNCFGYLNNSVPVNTTFGQVIKTKGTLNFISQSGAVAASLFDFAQHVGMGFNEVVTLGNKSVISENDILEHWLNNNYLKNEYAPIGMYLESITDGVRFLELTKEISLHSPIFLLKPGKSEEAKHAMRSHTGSLAGEDFILEKALQNAGIIRCYGLEDLFDMSKALSWEVFPNNPKVAVISNAGGPAVMSADIVSEYGLELAVIGTEQKKYLSEHLPRSASLLNPIDLLGDALADRYETALGEVLKQENIGSVVVLLTPQVMTEIEATAQKISNLAHEHNKTVLCSFIGGGATQEGEEILNKYKIPCFGYPERAIRILGLVYKWKKWQNDYIHEKGISVKDIKSKTFVKTQSFTNKALSPFEVDRILLSADIKVPESYLAITEAEAALAGEKLGFPAVAKVSLSGIIHKARGGGVSLNINNGTELLQEFNRIKNMDPSAGVFIQKQVEAGIEIIVGVKKDPSFGYFLLFGSGGTHAEIIKDRNVALFLDSYPNLLKVIGSTTIYQLVENKKGVLDVIDCLVGLINANPIFSEIEINPLIITKNDVWAVDGKAILL